MYVINQQSISLDFDANKCVYTHVKLLDPKCFDSWGYQDIPGKGIPPEDSLWKGRIVVDPNASWDNLIFTWMIIPCTDGEHWGKVVVTININQLVLDPIRKEKARQLSCFLKGVPKEMVNHCKHAFSLTVVV